MNDECNVDCLMCQTKRPRHLSPMARKSETSAVCRDDVDVSNKVPETEPLRQQNNDAGDRGKEPTKQVKAHASDQESISMHHSDSNNLQVKDSTLGESNSKWDAFESLENNYESSDSGDDDSDSDSDGSDASENYYKDDNTDDYSQRGCGQVGEDKSQWNAFKSLEATLGDESSSSSSSSGEESDCILIEDEKEKKIASADTSNTTNYKSECVDLVDTDDDEDVLRVKNTIPKKVNSRKRKPAITLMDDDSDSSYLSEVESSRPLQPSSAARQMRSIPPWQRAVKPKTKSTSILQNDRVLPRESFSLLSSRNDVSGSGLNETRTSAPAVRQSKQRKTSNKSSASTTKSGSRRRKRSNSDGAELANKKKRRTRKYKRSSKRGGRGGRGGTAASSSRNNNPWSARERGIRQPIRDNHGGGSYMNITKQEPILRNIGGASIQF